MAATISNEDIRDLPSPSEVFLRPDPEWTRKLRSTDLPNYNYFQTLSYSRPMPPVIGHTPQKHVRRFVFSRLYRVGYALQRWFARYTPVEDDYDCEGCYRRNEWNWVIAAGKRSRAALAQPIYDPDWVAPAPPKMDWGWASPAGSAE